MFKEIIVMITEIRKITLQQANNLNNLKAMNGLVNIRWERKRNPREIEILMSLQNKIHILIHSNNHCLNSKETLIQITIPLTKHISNL